VITADEGLRADARVPLKANVDIAADKAGCVKHVLVVKRTGGEIAWRADRDVWLDEAMTKASDHCAAVAMNAEDSAVHPLHLRIDRRAQGVGPHHRRLSLLRLDDPPICLSTITRATSTGAPPMSAG